MGRKLRIRWPTALGGLLLAYELLQGLWEWRWFKRLLGLSEVGQAVDWATGHWATPGWLGELPVQIVLVLIAGGLIFWDRRRGGGQSAISETDDAYERSRLEPSHLIWIGLGITLAGLAITAGGFWWQTRQLAVPPPLAIFVPGAAPPSSAATPQPLQPRLPPLIPQETSQRVARYLQLGRLIEDATSEKQHFDAASKLQEDMMTSNPKGAPRVGLGYSMAASSAKNQWDQSIERLRKINDLAYSNRNFDTQTVPELSNPLKQAPKEEEFESPDTRYQFRQLHFLNMNISKQAQRLIEDMKGEQDELSQAVKGTKGLQ